jgi:hypothetical protein
MSQELTQAEYDRLPALISRGTFRQWTGLTNEDVTEGVRAGLIKVFRLKKLGRCKYYRWQVAQFAGLMDSSTRAAALHCLERLDRTVSQFKARVGKAPELDQELRELRKLILK